MAPAAVSHTSAAVPAPSSKQPASSNIVHLPGSDVAFAPTTEPYQRRLKLVESDPDEREVTFPLILRPALHASRSADQLTTTQLIEAVTSFAPTPSTEYQPSKLQQLMDAHGGAVHFKGLPIRDADDFSKFMHALAGTSTGGDNAGKYNLWQHHVDKGLMVIRHTMAPNVATANEGPPHQSIESHNEYGLSMHYPSVIAFCCLSAPTSGGQTPIVNSLALYDRLKTSVPGYTEKIQRRGLTFIIHHPIAKVQGSVQGNSVYNADSFGPTADAKVDLATLTEEQKRRLVEDNILELAREGGWSDAAADGEGRDDGKLGAWHQRGFSWTWLPDGSINVFQRVPGIRIHPTLQKPAYFNNVGNRYAYSKEHGCLQPPHYSEEKKDYFPPPSFPRPLGEEEGGQEDEPIPLEWLESAHRWTKELQAHVEWEQGDILVIDNLAVQHARTPWEGPRKLVASLWDQRSYLDKNVPIRS